MPLEFNHTCIDTETLSTHSDAVIVTIAAVKFRFDTDETERFCVNINPREGKELGLHISKETLDWWRAQKPEATKAWMHSQVQYKDGISQFLEFCGTDRNQTYWCNGASFDFPILETSFRKCGLREPWNYFHLMDMRTVYKLAKLDFKNYPRVGQHHNALDDCLTQIKALKEISSG